MVRWVLMAVLAALPVLLGTPAMAEERVTLGWGRIFTNDQIGDGKDRWRTGSYTVSRVRGPSWQGHAGHGFGDILELRGKGSEQDQQRVFAGIRHRHEREQADRSEERQHNERSEAIHGPFLCRG